MGFEGYLAEVDFGGRVSFHTEEAFQYVRFHPIANIIVITIAPPSTSKPIGPRKKDAFQESRNADHGQQKQTLQPR